MTLQEKTDEKMSEELANQIQKNIDTFAIDFAMFLSNNLFENMFQDLNKDGKTWASYNDDSDDIDLIIKYTIHELLEMFKIVKKL